MPTGYAVHSTTHHGQRSTAGICRCTHGFTLVETLIAAVVFAVGILAMGSVQLAVRKLNTLAHVTTQLTSIAQEQQEELLTLPAQALQLQDVAPQEAGKKTTYCILYPLAGLRACKLPESQGMYCMLIVQEPGHAACSDAALPPPPVGYKVVWDVDANVPRQRVTTIEITAARKIPGLRNIQTFSLSFARP